MSAATAEAAARVSDRDTAPPRDDGARRQRWKRLAWTWAPVWAVTLLGGLLRFWHLGRPHKLMFDETYYVKDAYSLLRRGVEFNWAEDANELFERGDFSGLEATGSYVVHPPVGKWLIA
ncbi:MAG: phospholipid carrier-dependent glycosyltransferase, partial [Bifidobacteriaceae bacterium]|nr:phospholipid carrier-dependent glycosyltransferase [Bifidobacteriaceae bacterium]